MGRIVIGLYGAGGFGKEVMSLLPTIMPSLFPQTHVDDIKSCFIDDDSTLKQVIDKDVLSLNDFLELKHSDLYYCITIADPHTRKLVALKLKTTNIQLLTLIFNNSILLSHSYIGPGSIVMPGATISASVNIGMFTHVNFNSYIAHDCNIDNFVTISPSVNCCGNTEVKEGAFIGAGSIIKQGTKSKLRYIGVNSKLGMGSSLLTDLPDNKTYAGNPAVDLKS
jgi:sugar O-acyltransferase (sialic acid O-acetyltransferase NeuD family)